MIDFIHEMLDISKPAVRDIIIDTTLEDSEIIHAIEGIWTMYLMGNPEIIDYQLVFISTNKRKLLILAEYSMLDKDWEVHLPDFNSKQRQQLHEFVKQLNPPWKNNY